MYVFFNIRYKQGITLNVVVIGSLFVVGSIVSLFALFLSGFNAWSAEPKLIVSLISIVLTFIVSAFIFPDLKQFVLQGLSKMKSNIAK